MKYVQSFSVLVSIKHLSGSQEQVMHLEWWVVDGNIHCHVALQVWSLPWASLGPPTLHQHLIRIPCLNHCVFVHLI